MKNVKDAIKNFVVSGKKFVAGASLVALTAFLAPVGISAADEADSEKNKEKRKKLEQLDYICLDDDCETCIAADCTSMDDFCIKPCEDILFKYDMDPFSRSDKAKGQKLVAIQRNFNTKNR